MRQFTLFCVVTAAMIAAASAAEDGFQASPEFDIRVRQEVLDGVYHFAPDPDRNWLRVRTRAGASTTAGEHAFKLLLTNEHRHTFTPDDIEFDWDELILDQAWWDWTVAEGHRLVIGRQNIIWDKGFLMLEGHPLDGSRSIYHNAVRYRGNTLDAAFIHNPKYDPLVIAGDIDRPLTDADETAVAVRFTRGQRKWSMIWKNEVDPDHFLQHLQPWTLGGRTDLALGEDGDFLFEGAFQYLDESGDDDARGGGVALALQTHAEIPVGRAWRGKLGYFHYSGDGDGDLRAFRTPWGRWPKWSELYIYTLIGESTAGRVHVAAWENVAAPHLTLSRPLGSNFDLRLNTTYLLAPNSAWAPRGLLTQAELKVDIVEGLKGHLLWEMLDPGALHDGRGGLPPLTNTVHFLRWQLAYALP
jgi:hypothetical protein